MVFKLVVKWLQIHWVGRLFHNLGRLYHHFPHWVIHSLSISIADDGTAADGTDVADTTTKEIHDVVDATTKGLKELHSGDDDRSNEQKPKHSRDSRGQDAEDVEDVDELEELEHVLAFFIRVLV